MAVTFNKISIDASRVLDESEKALVELSLKSDAGLLIHKELVPTKNDYCDNYDRGSVDYSEKCKNYSFHKIIIPDGSVISGCNFSQRKPNTSAISGKNITFSECNLINNVIDETWKLNECNISQIDFEARELAEKAALEDK